MDHIVSLIQWLVTYSVTGGFWHFIACYLIVCAITRIFRFVTIETKGAGSDAAKSQKAA